MDKKKQNPPIMVGDVNIEPMKEEELILMNRDFVNKIYRLRIEQSNCRREMDLILQHIDNTRNQVKAVKSKRLIRLAEYDKHDPKVLDALKAARGNMNFIIYDLNLSMKKQKDKLVEKRSVMKESESDDELIGDPVIRELKKKSKKNYNLLQQINRRCRAEVLAYNLRSTKMIARKRLIRRMTKILKKRTKHAKELYLKRLGYIKDCYENRFNFFELEDNKYWHRFKKIMESHYEDCEYTEKTYLRRLIMNEELMIQACNEYTKKIRQSKEKIHHYKQLLNLAEQEQLETNNEMIDLKKKSSVVMNNQQVVAKLRKKIKEMKEEYDELITENQSMNEKFIKIDKVWKNYGDIIEACNELWSMNTTDDHQSFLKEILQHVTERVFSKLKELLNKLTDKTRCLVCQSLVYYIDRLRPLQYEVIKNVKAYNELVEFGEKFINDYNFINDQSFETFKGVNYRKLPARAFNYVCCEVEDLALYQNDY